MDLVIFFRVKEIIDFSWFSKGYVSLAVALATIEAVSLGFWALKNDGPFCHLEYTHSFLKELKIIDGTILSSNVKICVITLFVRLLVLFFSLFLTFVLFFDY